MSDSRPADRLPPEEISPLQTALDAVPTPIAMLDGALRVQFVNAALHGIVGDTGDSLPALADALAGGEGGDALRAAVEATIEAAAAGAVPRHDAEVELPGRRYRIAATDLGREAADGRYLIAFTDLTEVHGLATKLQDQEVEHRRTERIARVGSWRLDLATGANTWSDEMYVIMGHPRTFEPTTDARRKWYAESSRPAIAGVEEAMRERRPFVARYEIVRPNGGRRLIENVGEPQRDSSGNVVAYFGTVRDVTDEVAHERELERDRRRLERAQAISRTGDIEVQLGTATIFVSPEFRRLFDLDPGDDVTPDLLQSRVHPEDRDRMSTFWTDPHAAARAEQVTYRVVTRNGETRHLRGRSQSHTDSDGMQHVTAFAQDVTDETIAGQQLRLSEARLRAAEEIASLGHWEWFIETGELSWSDQVHRMFGLPRSEPPTYRAFVDRIHPDDREAVLAAIARTLESDAPYEARHRIVHPDGSIRVVQERGQLTRGEDGHPLQMLGVVQDVTEAVAATEQLRLSEARLRAAERIARVGSWEWDLATGELTWSDELYAIYGRVRGAYEPHASRYMELVHPEDRDRVLAEVQHATQTGDLYDLQHRILLPDGSVRVIRRNAAVVEHDEQGRAIRMIGTAQDVTEQAARQRELERLSSQLMQAQELARLGAWEWNVDTRGWSWSDGSWQLIFGERPGSSSTEDEVIQRAIPPEDQDRFGAMVRRLLDGSPAESLTHRVLWRDGSIHIVRVRAKLSDAFRPGHRVIIGTTHDITEVEQLRQDAVDAAAEVISIIDASLLPIIVADEHGIVQRANSATERVFGWVAEELVGQDVGVLAGELSVAEHQRYLQHYMATGEASTREGLVVDRTREVRARRQDGSEFPAQLTVAEAELGTGRRQFVGIVMDLTEQKATEEHLRQIQKSEALGTLVAGVAHDFNNLLTAIRGGIDMAQELPDDPRWLEISIQASDRATELVRQLLRFSRRDEPQQMPMEAADLVREATLLSRETLDRRIWFSVHTDDDLPPLFGDPGQMQQVLMNLVVNARDAVLDRAEQEGGEYEPAVQLTARALTVDGRQGVILEVRDNGTGMTDDVRQRALDPFFTTKPPDRGTGLGLATVAGIVRRHEGTVTIHSVPGEGSDVGIWLPSRTEPGSGTTSEPAAEKPREPHGDEGPLILLVDDEAAVGAIASAYLQAAGFRALAFADGNEALRATEGVAIGLAIVDLNMPAPNGWELMAALRRRDPSLPVLVASGYVDEDDARVRGAAGVLAKPYRRSELIDAVTELLRTAGGDQPGTP